MTSVAGIYVLATDVDNIQSGDRGLESAPGNPPQEARNANESLSPPRWAARHARPADLGWQWCRRRPCLPLLTLLALPPAVAVWIVRICPSCGATIAGLIRRSALPWRLPRASWSGAESAGASGAAAWSVPLLACPPCSGRGGARRSAYTRPSNRLPKGGHRTLTNQYCNYKYQRFGAVEPNNFLLAT